MKNLEYRMVFSQKIGSKPRLGIVDPTIRTPDSQNGLTSSVAPKGQISDREEKGHRGHRWRLAELETPSESAFHIVSASL